MSFAHANVQDAHDILTLSNEVSQAADKGEHEKWADGFTEDGVFNSPKYGVSKGRKALIEFITSFTDAVKGGRHITTNHLIMVDGDKARQECYLIFTVDGKLVLTGQYVDDLIRTDGKWKFSNRMFLDDSKDADLPASI